ncbi:serine/threonine-protein kinase [Candidatus Oleimmundimicrobium sp.]|uniref:serine/threonine-protein kinase n=1 Tax=Candidatus Oleimmundimicrobium sp. TaxID=3060597 RepID=UPI00271F8150|nr:serine/threonine-protein kinase [Candidatus Oleimmundimicrobium sp.]MDO8886816.1 serine/threonine-protein kinase [Candidatus Oleimmundimicrobium sp.]
MAEEFLLERFQVLEEIGSGGFAKVYKAFDTRMERVVAIKVIPIDTQSAPRTMREAQTAALLNHPNIVTLHEFDEDEENYYLIMEYISGVTLSKILKWEAPLSLDQSIAIASQICLALECAHSNDIIHRDIKPENIMLLRDGRVKVMDFGIARLKGTSTLTSEGSAIGTIGYMSPEQVSGDYLDEATDIFALGVVFYEMLTGENPFEAETPAATIFKIMNLNPPSPNELNPLIPKKLDHVIATALAKNPDDRYRTITQTRYKIEKYKRPGVSLEKILKPLYLKIANNPDYFEDEFENEEFLESLRASIWDIWETKQESISKIFGASLMALTCWFALNGLAFYPSGFALFLPLIIFLIALFSPSGGLALLPIIITPAIFSFSPALAILFATFSIIYIVVFGWRNPLAAIIPITVPILAKINLALLFPFLAGLFLAAPAASITSGAGCLSLELYDIFSGHSVIRLFNVSNSFYLAKNLKGVTNPFIALLNVLEAFVHQPVLLFQIITWALCGFVVGWLVRNRRLAGNALGFSLGLMLLLAGYVWLPSLGDQPSLALEEALQAFSFSVIILILLLMLIPYKQVRMKQKSKVAFEDDEVKI